VRRLLLAGLLLLAAPAAAAAAPAWHRVEMPVPPGGTFPTAVGVPADLSFYAPNRGLMMVGGNNSVPEGIYSWDGVEWHQLSTVCGGGANARIAWAGPTEFWTITRPSLPRPQLPGLGLCHFKDGEVVGSYSAPEGSVDPYHELLAAECRAPNDCWFGGVAGRDGAGQRVGAFHLHWNGSELRTVYGPQGRAVSDLMVHANQWVESTFVGRRPFPTDKTNPELLEPEEEPRLIHGITGEAFANDAFVASTFADGGTELRALDSNGQTAWAVGGGALSGPALIDTYAERPPLAARLEDGVWTELDLTPDLGQDDILADVAAVPGTEEAWTVVRDGSIVISGLELLPQVAHIAEDGATELETLAELDEPDRGAAWRIACPAADDCWMATFRGYLYRWFDPAAPPVYVRDTHPAFQGTITVRPNEAAEQTIPDAPPEDDSLPPPPIEVIPPEPEPLPPCRPLRPLVHQVKAQAASATRLVVRFKLRRAVRVQLIARRGKKVVARTPLKRMRPGKRALTLKVSRERWPNRLRFNIKGDNRKRKPCEGGGGDGNTVTTRATSAASW
jgi:hypothetical protein